MNHIEAHLMLSSKLVDARQGRILGGFGGPGPPGSLKGRQKGKEKKIKKEKKKGKKGWFLFGMSPATCS